VKRLQKFAWGPRAWLPVLGLWGHWGLCVVDVCPVAAWASPGGAAATVSPPSSPGPSRPSGAEPASRSKVLTDAQGRKIQVVDFDEATIDGKAKAPDGFVIRTRVGGVSNNTLELRRDFRKKMIGHAHDGVDSPPRE
jgi:hypothetical protein